MVNNESKFETKTSDSACCGAAQERSARSEVINVMQGFSKALPLYVWLVALPQLISRICHPHLETQRITQHILTRVTSTYPHQACFSSFPRFYSPCKAGMLDDNPLFVQRDRKIDPCQSGQSNRSTS